MQVETTLKYQLKVCVLKHNKCPVCCIRGIFIVCFSQDEILIYICDWVGAGEGALREYKIMERKFQTEESSS